MQVDQTSAIVTVSQTTCRSPRDPPDATRSAQRASRVYPMRAQAALGKARLPFSLKAAVTTSVTQCDSGQYELKNLGLCCDLCPAGESRGAMWTPLGRPDPGGGGGFELLQAALGAALLGTPTPLCPVLGALLFQWGEVCSAGLGGQKWGYVRRLDSPPVLSGGLWETWSWAPCPHAYTPFPP